MLSKIGKLSLGLCIALIFLLGKFPGGGAFVD